jgi:AcrR family transcriptional regulator
MAPSPDPPKWRRRKDARPSEIVSSALEVFVEKGFAAAKLDDIAARAGISKGALYLYFETKQDLFEAVVTEAIAPQVQDIERLSLTPSAQFADIVRASLPRLAAVMANTPLGKVAKLVISESGNFPELARIWHDRLLSRELATLASLIERAQARGEVRPGDPRAHALSLVAPLVVAVLFRETFVPIGAKPFDLPALMDQHLETVLAGLLLTDQHP